MITTMSTASDAELSTAQLAARTGLPAGTLRMWESRHGFPAPVRLPGGHRRYSERDVETVLDVLRLRAQGLSLPAAIAQSRRHSSGETSVFAGLRRRRPDVAPASLPKPTVLALSHAIEDEYLARAANGFVFGSFQHPRFYRIAERRWRELARTADLAVAIAAFARADEPPHAPAEVPVELRHPLAREWTVIVDAPGAHACLAAWEQPSQNAVPDRERRFEVMWSFEPEVVAAAVETAGELLWDLAPEVARRLPERAVDVSGGADDLRFAAALSQRMVRYVGALVEGASPRAAAGRA
jgi:MerR family transcriptional regulator, light-induced transcriptional regulator